MNMNNSPHISNGNHSKEENTTLMTHKTNLNQLNQILADYSVNIEEHFNTIAKRHVKARMEVVKEALDFMDAEQKFEKENFYSNKFVYLVSKKWEEKWKQFCNYNLLKQKKDLPWKTGTNKENLSGLNKDLLDNRTPILKFTFDEEANIFNTPILPNLKEGIDYNYYNEEMWSIVKKYDGAIEIKREVVEKENGEKSVEVNLQKIKLVFLSHQIMRDHSEIKNNIIPVFNILYSKYRTISQFESNAKELILETLNKEGLFNQNIHSTAINFLFVSPAVDIQQLQNKIKKSIEYQSKMKEKTVYIDVTPPEVERNLGDQYYLDEITFICEVISERSQNTGICYNEKRPIIATCPHCSQLREINECECKYIAYCNEKCKKADVEHVRICPSRLRTQVLKNYSERAGLVGLTNLGNTCFMNSGIQCLSNIKELTDYFITEEYLSDINQENKLGTGGNLVRAYAHMMKAMWSGTYSTFNPYDFKKALCRFQRMFAGNEQHDSGEFLSYLLDGIHEDLNKVKNKPYFESKDTDDRPDRVIADEQWRHLFLRNNSKIVELMYGQYRSQVDCPKCKYKSLQFDPFLMCSLPIPSQSQQIPQKTFQFIYQKENSMEEMIILPYSHRQTLKDIGNEMKEKYGISRDYVFMSPKIPIKKDEEISDVKLLLKEKKIYFRYLLDQEQQTGLNIFVTFKCLKRKANHEVVKHTITDKLFKVNPSITLKELHLFLYENHKNFHDAGNYEEMNCLECKEVRITSKINENQSLSFCWLCKQKECKGCLLPYSNQTLSEKTQNKKEFHLDYFLTKELPEEFNKEINPKINPSGISHGITLLDCFKAFEEPETLNEENAWFCPKCKDFVPAQKQIMIYRSPEILMLCLKRFKKRGYQSSKNHSYIHYPVKDLDLSKIVLSHNTPSQPDELQPTKPLLYDLFAVSCHMGESGGGHYIAQCKNSLKEQWYNFNDSTVSPISESKLVHKDAYILFYKKK